MCASRVRIGSGWTRAYVLTRGRRPGSQLTDRRVRVRRLNQRKRGAETGDIARYNAIKSPQSS
jgi:hypothetical protein